MNIKSFVEKIIALCKYGSSQTISAFTYTQRLELFVNILMKMFVDGVKLGMKIKKIIYSF